MKNFLFSCAFALLLAIPVIAESVVAPDAKLQKLAGGFAFTEGATCDKVGNVFFVDQPNNRILEWSTDGKLSTFMQPSEHANGMMFDAKGNLIACADEHNQLWSIAPDKTVTLLVTNFEGKRLNGPNDVWISPNGGIYMTDPFYRRSWGDVNVLRVKGEEVFYLSPDHKTLKRVVEDFKRPNGITGTPDGKTLYISDIRADQTWRYAILQDGSLTNKTLFCPKGSDGMTIDEKGNLYLCANGPTNGVTVFDKSGNKIDHIDVPEKWSANVCFGGKDRQTLFITASTGFYSIRMNVKGANPTK